MTTSLPVADRLSPADQRVVAWLTRLEGALTLGEIDKAVGLFAEDCYWRDLVAFTWNITTQEGRDAIGAMLHATLPDVKPRRWHLAESATEADGVTEAWIRFETEVFCGNGQLRLRGDQGWTLLTAATELKGFEEKSGPKREKGVAHGIEQGRRSWRERKEEEEAELGKSQQPYCLVVGGGQGGIGLGARLKRIGVPTIIIDKHERPGDQWRNRYKSLHLHDPVWYDHLPYLPFPDHWPVFAAKDKVGDWLESYTKIMELNYWPKTECKAARYDEAMREWSVEVLRDGRPMTLRPKHLILALGVSGMPNTPDYPGMETFQGVSPPFEPTSRRRGLARQESGGDRLQQLRPRHLRGFLGERRRGHHGAALLDAYRALELADGAGARWAVFRGGGGQRHHHRQGGHDLRLHSLQADGRFQHPRLRGDEAARRRLL